MVIGSCTNGRLEDLEDSGKDVEGQEGRAHEAHNHTGHADSYTKEAMKKGYFDIFPEGRRDHKPAYVRPCLGGHMGILAPERGPSTTNRNFIGRMGDVTSEVYLANPAVAAATAVKGRIYTHPDEVFKSKSIPQNHGFPLCHSRGVLSGNPEKNI